MELTYKDIDFSQIEGDSVADYLISVQARFWMVDAGVILYYEPYFTIAELARSLAVWLRAPEETDYYLDSLVSEVIGLVSFEREAGGWRVFSAQAPHMRSRLVSGEDLRSAVGNYIEQVSRDLQVNGYDAVRIIG